MDFCFFLIGFKEFNKPLADVGTVNCYCGNCHNQSAHAVRTINCVTLFFIPVLPFYFSKRLKCSICGASGDLDSTAIDRMKQGQPVAIG
ncbi:Piso0_000286 [Millerozyma farinosa CBS 7064]|uniref:Piso0_000286 protein n=1 Tax=Pichia sorbitophila (strain ATCC MYA-4447 / BCRC 22081 / CBS 7064 / NBRC 10061 / NRRL Y-12695) TaxID=559304 RepID=G8YV12_PICSO|nr:Piso0_000286 [Millerozyma farinosa CBS 7064]